MTIAGKGPRKLFILLAIAGAVTPAFAQTTGDTSKQGATTADVIAQSDSRVSAEMVRGKLNPATSKPGDAIVLRITEDVKSEGKILLTRGSTIRGVVRKVRRSESKSSAKGNAEAQSMMEIEWIAPGLSGSASQQLKFALQSVVYANPLYTHQLQEESGNTGSVAPRAPAASRSSGGLIGGVGTTTGTAVSTVTSGAGVAGQTSGSVVSGTVAQVGSPVPRPSAVVPVSAQTSSSLQSNFGVSGNQLFLVGSGHATSAGGTTTSMDLFSHMSNDTVITSRSRDFEVSSGAQMELLVRTKQ